MNVETLYEIFPNPAISMDIEHGQTAMYPKPKVYAHDLVSIRVSWSMTGSGPSSHAAMAHLVHQIKACIERAEDALAKLEETE